MYIFDFRFKHDYFLNSFLGKDSFEYEKLFLILFTNYLYVKKANLNNNIL